MCTLPWQRVNQAIRSRLFLLFTIVLLAGFLLIHYSGPRAELLPGNRRKYVLRPNIRAVKLVQATDLAEDSLPTPYLSENTGHDLIISESVTSTLNVLSETEGSQTVPTACKKQLDVSFLKVHKAGSTTVMNIFLRFAISHNINIVLPHKSNGFGFNYLGYGKTVSRDAIVPLPRNETYNILCNHVVYNREAFRSILPADTTYMGILREPVSHFRSASLYYGFYNQLKEFIHDSRPPLSEFLKNTDMYKIGTYFVHNRMSYDLGIPPKKFNDDIFVEEYIRQLDRDYALMMIMERFAESLVLLRRTLCWTTKDILYVPLNAMINKPNIHLTEEDVEHLSEWNKADFKLYDYFRIKFDKTVQIEGQDLQDEVDSFTAIKDSVIKFCVDILKFPSSSEAVKHVPNTRWSPGFDVTKNDCRLMTEEELPMMHRLINQAWQHYNSSL
ncbi:galactosylceramide sulfotransferase-like [Mya arenaria]|uniref:galactosylceramide sulfotransferase-like n=1 Tax=Mya arenaria TaxID=6604 RepID=UPI0022E5DFC6|nr:galactosylceramide sulfotransferase-like [Mya arenaria]XP_052792572.1 galactosylceramide sulfotransferase-like [Mya arenaria]XP_052792573.1 galactosylceramide sulfotransferase-like [Mya arenaria]XP_052792574.1 galactosylceramide sulfotransferase-like [Mya arenaria]XP_052792575.1 galactosylceramide sulfotransferase-like [Mya arenaria]XP_052792576.1 galactosylceramide sulfotransferase-like [Mya arenaria]XP_052792577.1 galactosylceramide sulfotransferase-like [Mya arenaria]